MTPSLVGALCVGLLIASVLRGRGNLQKLRDKVDTTINPPVPVLVVAPVGPGGQDPIKLTRSAVAIGKDVEFLSVTLLPGRGMNVFQITAMVPGHGEVPLLMAPDVDGVARLMSDKDEDAHGETSMTMGGAFELPWAGRLTGTEMAGRPGVLAAQWQGTQVSFPAIAPGSLTSVDGLFLDRKSADVKSDVLPDGQYAQGTFHAKDFDGHWPSTVDVTVMVEMGAHALDLTVSATNTGKVAVPFGMGWHPMFAVPSGNRMDATVQVASNTLVETNRKTGIPSGRLVNVEGTSLDFSRERGVKLGSQDVDATFTKLQADVQSSHSSAEIRDQAWNLSVKVIPLSANITNMRVVAPADKKWVSISPATNLPDALGAEWRGQDAGMTSLAPGATMQWKVRVQIAAIVAGDDR